MFAALQMADRLPESWRRDAAAVALCTLLGIFLSVLPNLLWQSRLGEPVWIADRDDLSSLAASSNAYYNHPTYLGDVLRETGGDNIFPALLYLPFVLVARVLGLPPIHIILLWRLWAGLGIAVGLYLLLRLYVRDPLIAASVTIFLMSDIGLLTCHPLIRQLTVFPQLLSGRANDLLSTYPQISTQWRVLTPAAILPFLLIYLWLLARARLESSRSRILLAGLTFGLLFYIYAYYWMAAGLGLLLAMLLDTKHRKTYFLTALTGSLIGLPSVIHHYLVLRRNPPDWGMRSEFVMAIPRFSQLLLPKLAIILLTVGLVWVWRRRRDLIYLWALSAAGIMLANHQVVTGLQTQNWHWAYVWGTGGSLLLVLSICGELSKRKLNLRYGVLILFASSILFLGSGLWMRGVEATRTKESVELTLNYRKYLAQRGQRQTVPLLANGVIAGDQAFVDLAVILENQRPLQHYSIIQTPSVTTAEWDGRIALNAFLQGQSRLAFEQQQREFLANDFGPWRLDAFKREERITAQLLDYDDLATNLDRALKRFGINYVVLPAEQSTPEYLLMHDWTEIESGEFWHIWQRTI